MDRVPVKEQKESLVVLGIDPGFANVGLSIVEYANGKCTVLATKLVTTKKQSKKVCVNLRVNVDDQRRYREIYEEIISFAEPHAISAVSAESYTVTGARGGNAWKAAVVFGGICFWAFCNNIYLAPFLPLDLKTRFCKAGNSTKEDVENALRNEVIGFSSEIAKYGKTKQEHISDATGHSILLLEEITRNRVMFSI